MLASEDASESFALMAAIAKDEASQGYGLPPALLHLGDRDKVALKMLCGMPGMNFGAAMSLLFAHGDGSQRRPLSAIMTSSAERLIDMAGGDTFLSAGQATALRYHCQRAYKRMDLPS